MISLVIYFSSYLLNMFSIVTVLGFAFTTEELAIIKLLLYSDEVSRPLF